MTSKYHQNLMRSALLSKEITAQSSELPAIQQIILKVKAENSYDLINNLSLLISTVGTIPQLSLVNQKNSLLLPAITLNCLNSKIYGWNILTLLMNRLADKMITKNYGVSSNKLTFVFKGSDAITSEIRKVWKLFGYELGVFTTEVTFITTSHNSVLNEAFLRGYHLPILIQH